MNMLKHIDWKVRIGILLVILSAILYFLNFTLFHDAEKVWFYLSIDMAFVPLEVLLVVLVIESVISRREKSIMLEKLNMVIGTFFSEVGTELLTEISKFDSKSRKTNKTLIINENWVDEDFINVKKDITNSNYFLDIDGTNNDSLQFLIETKEFLKGKHKFLLALLENPNLLEHETFTDLLRAVFHLTEELEKRKDISNLSNADYQHLKLDTERAYNIMIYEWVEYMEYLMKNYPYLFSLAMRTNPFDQEARVELKDP
ncbi:hypothetical protein [Methanobacterium sp. SMA-27]|uniref:hypothetical protein n=1 Tax=Methanobacterium sp. SMA-27 TaxID=1495336 RepID=UPI00064E7179|nr:hypothetical protein [Methanobacterium sp. SMA-27]